MSSLSVTAFFGARRAVRDGPRRKAPSCRLRLAASNPQARPQFYGNGSAGDQVNTMSRTSLAILIGIVGFVLYILAVVALGDYVVLAHWAVQTVYYVVVGIIWVWPAKWLMIWGAGGRRVE
ncbi:DUF2842 domain-containing protein [Roseococcus thiosulfatophilus]|uniref:DUF2842 domain-containing protein n=1 Tax=Roseococcus thiosulfatophilus TaxID=35813 RepID=UPI001A8BF4C5|nr:DUF2842 domain-containing protein [Roseococcus thiosulfatophilus]